MIENYQTRSTLQIIKDFMSSDNENTQNFAEQYINTYPHEFITCLSSNIDEVINSSEILKVIDKLLDMIEDVADNLDEEISRLSFHIFSKCLILQPEEPVENEYGVVEAGSIGMSLLSDNYEGIYQISIPYITNNITSDNWRLKDAAVTVFGSLMCSEFAHPQILVLIQHTISLLPHYLQSNQHLTLRRSTAWTIGRLFTGKFSLLLSLNNNLVLLLSSLINSLNDSTNNSSVLQQTLHSICLFAESASNFPENDNPILYDYIPSLLEKLLTMTNSVDNPTLDHNIRSIIYETMSAVILSNNERNKSEMNIIFIELIQRFQWSLNFDLSLISSLSSVIFTIISQVDKNVLDSNIEILTNILLQATTIDNQTTLSEVLLTFSKFIDLEPLVLERHHALIIPRIIELFQQDFSIELCQLVGDVSRSFSNATIPYLPQLMSILITKLRETSERKLQVAIISAIGDLFLGIESNHTNQYIAPYLDYLRILQTPDLFENNREINQDDESNNEDDDESENGINSFQNSENFRLIEALITSYISIVQNIKLSSNRPLRIDLLSPYLHVIIHLISNTTISRSPHITNELSKESLGLLGDLWSLFGERIEEHIPRNEIQRFIQQNPSIDHSIAAYLAREIQRGPPPGSNQMEDE